MRRCELILLRVSALMSPLKVKNPAIKHFPDAAFPPKATRSHVASPAARQADPCAAADADVSIGQVTMDLLVSGLCIIPD